MGKMYNFICICGGIMAQKSSYFDKKNFSLSSRSFSVKKRIGQLITILVLILLIVLVFIITILKKDNVVVTPEAPVYVEKPTQSNLENTYRVTGNVESQEMLTVLPKISGAISKLYVDVEDYVEKGQVVAEIDSEPFELTLKQAQAAYNATLSTWQRIDALYRSGGASQQQHEEVKAKFNATEAQLNLAKLQVSYCKIRSEISGRVLLRHDNINVGMLVANSSPIFTIGQPDKLMIKAKIPESKFPFFNSRRSTIGVRIEVPSYNAIYDGYIDRISPYIEPASKSFVVYCKPTDKNTILPPGLSIKLNFVIDSRDDVFKVSRRALVGDDTLWLAVLKPGSSLEEPVYIAQKRAFIPPFLTSNSIMVDDSLKDSYIVVDGNAYLYQGQKLIIKNSHEYPELFLSSSSESSNLSESDEVLENQPSNESSEATVGE